MDESEQLGVGRNEPSSLLSGIPELTPAAGADAPRDSQSLSDVRNRVKVARLELEEAQPRVQTARVRYYQRVFTAERLHTSPLYFVADGKPGVRRTRREPYA